MIEEIITDAIVGGGLVGSVTAVYMVIKRRFGKKPTDKIGPNALGAYPFLWERSDYNSKNSGFRCPKCRARKLNKKNLECCTCENYHTEHFHFECKACKFKCIMRTADDK